MRRVTFLLILVLLISLLPVPAAGATEKTPVPIRTPEELAQMAKDPAGSYILMNDLDMTGVSWKSLDFSGSLDGNGHAILNLTLSEPGEATPMSMDGNRKEYETQYVGLFGSLTDAVVKNLNLINVRALVETDEPCFLAGIAGYCENSAISDCTVSGTLELRAHDRIFGVGGVIGFGCGTVERCQVDVTLICTDTDAATKDEQFLGGVFAAGFVDVVESNVHIQGYASEHGYAHNGGITGMYIQYPLETKHFGKLDRNRVEGFISFFEDNRDRRAYCKAYCGETLAYRYSMQGNTQKFKRDEHRKYDVELRPEMCPVPVYAETIVAASQDTFGYTEFACETCDHTYRDHYTVFAEQKAPQAAAKP